MGFQSCQRIFEALTIHLRPIIHHLRNRITIRNPLFDDLKKKYPATFEESIIEEIL
ncbi:MAG: PRD domain-containing protein [Caldibacillus sp.]